MSPTFAPAVIVAEATGENSYTYFIGVSHFFPCVMEIPVWGEKILEKIFLLLYFTVIFIKGVEVTIFNLETFIFL